MSNLKGIMYLNIHSATDNNRVLEIQKLNKAIARRNATIEKMRSRLNDFKYLETAFNQQVEHEVEERLSSMNAEAEAWDKDAANLLIQICEEWGIDRNEYPDGITIQDAYDYLFESKREYDELKFRMYGLEK